jgi:O-antigen/teichoic acid export membrane protein
MMTGVKMTQEKSDKSETALRAVLTAGSIVFGSSALFLLALPALFLQLLALDTNDALQWSMRMIGITLVALAGNMFANARRGSIGAVRLAGRVMQLSAGALGVLTLMIPAPMTWFTVLYAIVGFGFSAAYTIAFLLKTK